MACGRHCCLDERMLFHATRSDRRGWGVSLVMGARNIKQSLAGGGSPLAVGGEVAGVSDPCQPTWLLWDGRHKGAACASPRWQPSARLIPSCPRALPSLEERTMEAALGIRPGGRPQVSVSGVPAPRKEGAVGTEPPRTNGWTETPVGTGEELDPHPLQTVLRKEGEIGCVRKVQGVG